MGKKKDVEKSGSEKKDGSGRSASRKKRGGLGEGGRSLELNRPMGAPLAASVEAPPPPPPPAEAPRAALPPPPASLELPGGKGYQKPPVPMKDAPPGVSSEEESVEEKAAPPPPPPPPAVVPAKADILKVDLSLLPWVVKKQLAIETDQEELDFEITFWVEGKKDRLVLEGHRNDFGQIYVRGPETPEGCWKCYRNSEYAEIPTDQVYVTFRKHIVTVLVKTGDFEIEFSDMADFLEWAQY